MLFDLTPKSDIRELFNFEDELEKLRIGFEGGRIILLLGIRRVGKSSLLRSFLNGFKIPNIFIDSRRIIASDGNITLRGFMREFGQALNSFLSEESGLKNRLISLLQNVGGVEIDMPRLSVSLAWGRRNRAEIASVLDKVNSVAGENGLKLALAIDEAQELRVLPINFPALLAYIYDNLKNIIVILTGSQVGLLYDLLKIDDPESPLYGRLLYEVRLKRIAYEQAIEFLRLGFKEANVSVSEELIRMAVERLDGIVGWLTYFGWSVCHGEYSIEKILDKAAMQEIEELQRFLIKSRAERRYKIILKTLAEKPSPWSMIKKVLEAEEGIEIDDSNFTELLERLIKMGVLEKDDKIYKFADPVLTHGIKKFL